MTTKTNEEATKTVAKPRKNTKSKPSVNKTDTDVKQEDATPVIDVEQVESAPVTDTLPSDDNVYEESNNEPSNADGDVVPGEEGNEPSSDSNEDTNETPEDDTGNDEGEGDKAPGDNTGDDEVPVETENKSLDVFLTEDKIKTLLADAEMTNAMKIAEIAAKGVPVYKTLTAKLLGYNETMGGKGGVEISIGVSKQYDLLNTLKSVLNTENYGEFKTKFDIVNLVFREFGKTGAFKPTMLCRFDTAWKWSKRDLYTLLHLSTIIPALCNPATRETELKRIDMNKALNTDDINLSEVAISNLQKYYNR